MRKEEFVSELIKASSNKESESRTPSYKIRKLQSIELQNQIPPNRLQKIIIEPGVVNKSNNATTQFRRLAGFMLDCIGGVPIHLRYRIHDRIEAVINNLLGENVVTKLRRLSYNYRFYEKYAIDVRKYQRELEQEYKSPFSEN